MKKILQFLILGLILAIANVGLVSGFKQANPQPWNSSIFPKKSGSLFPGLEPEYHTYLEVVTELLQIQQNHRAIAEAFSLGVSYEGRDIPGIKISDNVQTEESEPEVFICSLHHAREAATVEVAMYIINFLTDNYGRDPYTTYLVNNREIYIVPIINPDGKVYDDSGGSYGSGVYWRKNRQPCTGGIGTDLNRNYSYQWGGRRSSGCCTSTESFRGYQPFDSPETAAVRDFVTSHPDITVFVDYHSFGGMVLWPWGYTTDPLSNLDDRQVHEIIGREYARITGYTPMATAELYLCSGISIDWTYGTTENDDIPIFSWGIELLRGNSPDTGFYPPPSALTTMCKNNCRACLYLIECADNPYKVLRQWKVSGPIKGGGNLVDSGGNFWYESDFSDAHWRTVSTPHYSEDGNFTHFYRHYMTIYHDTQQVLINTTLSDSITLYVNGQYITFKNSAEEYRGSGMGRGAYIDITEFVYPGENVIAVRVNNASEPFDMNIAQSTEMYDDKIWKTSFIADSRGTVDKKGNIWYTREFDDTDWDTCTLPDSDAQKWGIADKLYRRVFTVPLYTQVFFDFTGCDRVTVYVNGNYVSQANTTGGNSTHTPRGNTHHNLRDITELVNPGENVIAVCVSGGTPEFDMTLIRLKTLPDLRITSQDIQFSNPSPSPGDTITIRATSYNSSPVNTPLTTLRFYDGDPVRKALIGEILIEVPAQSFHTVEIQYVYPGDVHTIYAVIDEDNLIPEFSRETNNTAYATLPVPGFDSWPMFRHDNNHTGASQLSGSITVPVEKWRVSTEGPVKSSPSVGDINNDGKKEVVFGSDDHYVYAVASDGHLLWKVRTGDCVQSSPAISDINNDGRIEVVFGSHDQCVYCVKGEDGQMLWKFVTKGPVNSSPLVYDVDNDGNLEVIFGSHDGCLYAVKGEDGTLLWTFSTGGKISASPVVATMRGKRDLVMIGSGNTFYYLYASTGKKWGEIAGCGQFISSPAVGDIDNNGDLDIVIGNQDGSIYAEGGDLFWNHSVTGNVHSSPAVADIDHNGDREVISGSDTGFLYALNGEDGSILWSYQTGGRVYSSAAVGDIDGDHCYDVVVGSDDGCVYALKGVDGTVLWTFSTGAGIESSPAIADIDDDGDAEILIGSNDGNIYVLDSEGLSSGHSRRIFPIGIFFLIGLLFLGVLLLGGFLLKKRFKGI